MATTHDLLCGYGYEFLDPDVPDEFICLICTMVARDAHQSGCCGRIFCLGCLKLLKTKSIHFTCPNCRESLHQNYFADKNTMRKIRQLSMYCPNKDRECSWTGELQSVDSHISECPREVVNCSNDCGVEIERCGLEDHLKYKCTKRVVLCFYCCVLGEYQEITGIHEGVCPEIPVVCPNTGCGNKMKQKTIQDHRNSCLYEVVTCPNQCGNKYERHKIVKHTRIGCPKRVVKCSYCGDKGEYAVITGIHLAEKCENVPLPCPNDGCDEKFKRVFEADHLSVCRKQLVPCKYVGVCEKKVRRELEQLHYQEEMDQHLNNAYLKLQNVELKFKSLSTEVAKMRQAFEKLALREDESSKKILECIDAVSSVKTDVRTTESRCGDPIIFEVPWDRQPKTFQFYFHKGGHKFSFTVHPTGVDQGLGTHISLTLEVIEGKFDDLLKSIFSDGVTVELLNQDTDDYHCRGSFRFSNKKHGIRQSATIYRFCSHEDLVPGVKPFRKKKSVQMCHTEYLAHMKMYFKLENDIITTEKPWLFRE